MQDLNYRDINQEVIRTLSPPGKIYWFFVALCFSGILYGAACWAYQILTGMGVAGIQHSGGVGYLPG